jgi:hypothetical protein
MGLLLVVALSRHGDDANESGGKRNRSATGSHQGDDIHGKRHGAVKRRSHDILRSPPRRLRATYLAEDWWDEGDGAA